MPTINPLLFFKTMISSEEISEERKQLLTKIASFLIAKKVNNLNFICTHNSRRSQLAQIWAQIAIDYYKLSINVFSSGTEVTAFHKNTIKALQKVGFDFKIAHFSHENPTYSIHYKDAKEPIIGFSKLITDVSIKKPFIAITTCNNADKNCPFVPNAEARFHLPFEDPKKFDNTDASERAYLKTSREIASQMDYLFALVVDAV